MPHAYLCESRRFFGFLSGCDWSCECAGAEGKVDPVGRDGFEGQQTGVFKLSLDAAHHRLKSDERASQAA